MLVTPLAFAPRPRKPSQCLTIVKPDLTGTLRPARYAAAGTASSDPRDRALIARITRSDRAALKELYVLYHRRLARFLTRVTSRYDIAEEIINDTFWVVWQRAGDFRGASNVSTWIMGIAYRRGLKTLKRASVMHATVYDVPEEDAQSEEPWSGAELREWLGVALAKLPAEQRLVLELAYHMGHSCEEIATIMSCPVNTVKTRMFHARKKLKVLLPQLAGMDKDAHA